MVCAFLPLLKGALKDDTKSDNYRAIDLSSLILKVIDNIILIVWGDLLSLDCLQFGFKAGTGTSPCSWAVLEVVSMYHRQKGSVKAACLDLSKAFDKCLFSALFLKILNCGVSAIVVRGLLAMYSMQKCHIRWTPSKVISRTFSVSNGTKQGSCLSPCLFAIYMDELLQLLRRSGIGCHVLDLFAGAFFYADDLIILAPTRQALQEMLTICEDYATQHNMIFSVNEDPKKSKSKCIFFKYGREETPERLILNGKPLPWVETIEHLGHTIHESGKQESDCSQARAKFCEKSNEILSMFDFAHPLQKLTAINVYCNDWYGSMLWDLYGDAAGRAFRAWNTTVKIACGLDRATHTYIVEHFLSGNMPSVRQQIITRYIKFVGNLLQTTNPVISLLATLSVNCAQSITGKNLLNIKEEF